MKRKATKTVWAVLLAGMLTVPVWAQNYEEGDDPEHGVARLSLLNGDVTVQRGDTGEVVAGELNAPLVALDHVLTGPNSRAEVQFDASNMIRLAPVSEVRMGDLRDGDYFIQVAEGTATFRVLDDTRTLVEISTPTVSVRPVEKGVYRITVRPDGATEVTVRSGQVEIFTPRGTEILRSGKTMQARGTADNPDFMIISAISKDDWDRWNENRDQDLQRSQSYQYVGRDVAGAGDLDNNGRWVYDSPYGWVWVPNVTSTWAPYRVGRWSYVNYYGWTWISGDPWGWAPYHYGRWYSSPYGWAWYPGQLGYRSYWRPALVGFFGWGNSNVSFGVGFGYGNVGWVPLAPYEVYRPWYGRGYRNGTIINNITVVNNTNIINTYRNARVNGRNGVTSIPSGNFGRERVNVNNYVRASNTDLTRAGQIRGAVPFEQSRESRRYTDRTPSPDVATRINNNNNRNTQFAVSPDRSRRGSSSSVNAVTNTNARPVPDTGTVDRGQGNRSSGTRATQPAQTNSARRFESSNGSGNADRTGVTRGDSRSPSAFPNNSRDSGSADDNRSRRQGTDVAPAQRRAPAAAPPSYDSNQGSRRSQPVQVNPPIVRDRGSSMPQGNARAEAPAVRSAPRNSAPAPTVRSAPSNPAPAARSNGGGGTIRSSGGGGGGQRGASSAPAAPSAPARGSGGNNGGGGRRR